MNANAINARYSLFEHQLETVRRMKHIEEKQYRIENGLETIASFGINTNSFGAGKTRTTLRLIEDDQLTFDNCPSIVVDNVILRKLYIGQPNQYNLEYLYSTLVCMDKKLIGEWQKEATKVGFTDFISIDVPAAINPERMVGLVRRLRSKENAPKIVFCSCQIMFEFMTAIKEVIDKTLLWKRIVFDDLHATKQMKGIRHCPSFGALFTWFLNGTPELMQTNYAVVASRHLNLVGNYLDIAHKVYVHVPQVVYVPPALQVHVHKYRNNGLVEVLGYAIPGNVQDMLNTGDYEGAYKALLGADETHEVPIAERKPLHEIVIAKHLRELETAKQTLERHIQNGWRTAVVEEKIKEIENTIEGIRERIVKALEECECPICMDDCERNQMVFTKCCMNGFCRGCIGDLFKGKRIITCPVCRNNISMKDMYIFDEHGNAKDVDKLVRPNRPVVDNQDTLPRTPMEALAKICMEKPQGKFVVFAPFDGVSDSIKQYLKGSTITFAELTGMARTITKRLKEFEEGKYQVLFLNSRTGNSGFNLQFASDVVIIGAAPNLQNDRVKQITSRVARFPRTEEVPVHFVHC